MFFGGANFICKRVLQGPLTLGLHSTTFRSALPAATLPYPGADLYTAQTALLFFRSILSSSVTTDAGFYRVPLRFYLFQYPAHIIFRANRALVFSAFFCPRRLEPTLAFAGCSLRFYLFQYPAQSIQKK